MKTNDKLKEEALKNPEIKKEYDRLAPEFKKRAEKIREKINQKR